MRIIWFLLIFPLLAHGQKVTVKGVAPLSIGKEIQLRVFDDPISGTERALVKQLVDVDGSFELELIPPTGAVQYAFLQVGTDCADFFIERGKDLELSFVPPKEDPNKPKAFNERQFFMPKITGGTGKALNDQLTAFNDSLDVFLESIYPILKLRKSPKLVAERVQVFEKMVIQQHKRSHPFVADYVIFSIASIEQTFLTDRDRLFGKYLKEREPQFNNPAYVDFLVQFFEGTVHRMAVVDRYEEVKKALAGREAFAEMERILIEEEPRLKSSAIGRMILIDGMDELFCQRDFEDEQLITALDQFGGLSSNTFLGNAARNIARKHKLLKSGTEVPPLAFIALDGSDKMLSDLYGTYIFLELTDATNVYSNRETNVIPNLKEEFDIIRFVTLCVGNSERDVQQLKNKMGIDWTLGSIPMTSAALEDFQIKSLPLFFIIDPDGKFYAAPAKDPTKGAQQELMALKEKLRAKNKQRVGR